eukprot:358761_1
MAFQFGSGRNPKHQELLDQRHDPFTVEFLRACNNFNSDSDNASLLMHGYIRTILKPTYKKTVPKDIITTCTTFCLVLLHTQAFDKWCEEVKHSTNGHAILSNRSNNMLFSDDNLHLKVVKYGYGECFGLLKLFDASVRKLWKIQILTRNEREPLLSFAIGIDNYQNRFESYIENSHDELLVQDKDIVSVLFIDGGEDKNILRFAINGQTYGNKHTNINVTSANGHGARLFVSFHRRMDFLILD